MAQQEQKALLGTESLPGTAVEGEAMSEDELLVASYAPARALVERLEGQLAMNRTLLVEITSEENDLEAQKEELEEHASGLHQAFKVALDTPLIGAAVSETRASSRGSCAVSIWTPASTSQFGAMGG